MKFLTKITQRSKIKQLIKLPFWKKHGKWEWFILAVGVLTLFYLLINLFTSFGNQTPAPRFTRAVPLSEIDTFEKTLASSINSPVKHQAKILLRL